MIMGGGDTVMASYASSSLSPAWAIQGTQNFSGPMNISMDSKPSGMV
jgi:hypothetical protein